MQTHDGLPVAGYRPQSTTAIELVNANKIMEEQILRMIDAYQRELINVTPKHVKAAYDGRWLAVARTHIEEGFMAMNRAIFQPTRIDI